MSSGSPTLPGPYKVCFTAKLKLCLIRGALPSKGTFLDCQPSTLVCFPETVHSVIMPYAWLRLVELLREESTKKPAKAVLASLAGELEAISHISVPERFRGVLTKIRDPEYGPPKLVGFPYTTDPQEGTPLISKTPIPVCRFKLLHVGHELPTCPRL